jgi:hypothetical protein
MKNAILLWGLALLIVGTPIAAVSLTACDTVRDRAGAGASALVDCEAPNLRTAVAELVPVFRLAVLKLITGDGKVDTTALRAACAALVGDLPRCAMVSAIAILSVPAPNTGATVLAVPLLVPDPGALRLAFEAVRVDWGGASYKTAAGTI